MIKSQKRIAIIGTGYWGKNLVRNFAELKTLKAICDTDPEQLKILQNEYEINKIYSHPTDLLQSQDIDAVVIATPAATHYEIAKAALMAGKDVFLEKPLALTIHEAEEIVKIVDSKSRILMIDHLLQYHPAIMKLKELVDKGVLGKLQYIYSNRLNIGRLRTEENILWSFAPHDISVILMLVEKQPQKVRAFGEAYLQDHIYDTTITDLTFTDRLKAHIFVSWLHPFKEQKLVVIGNKCMAVFNDVEEKEKLTLYPHKIEWIKQIPVASKASKEIISIEPKEPLKEACLHFLSCLENRTQPKTDAQEALSVLKVLQQAQEYLYREKTNEK